jgi:hypothetical protein
LRPLFFLCFVSSVDAREFVLVTTGNYYDYNMGSSINLSSA